MKTKSLLSRLVLTITIVVAAAHAIQAEQYASRCDVLFKAESTLHSFAGNITNVAFVVSCDTNAAGVAMLNTRMEIAPRQLSTHHEKRDAEMYRMFQSDRFPKLIALVTNAPLAAAKLTPTPDSGSGGTLPVQLQFCGITREVPARTLHAKQRNDGWEFDLVTEVSLKAFNLKPTTAVLGMITVNDKVIVEAHVIVQKPATKS